MSRISPDISKSKAGYPFLTTCLVMRQINNNYACEICWETLEAIAVLAFGFAFCGQLYYPCFFISESGSAICTFFTRGMCSRGVTCPFRHVKGDRTVVCKHWLRGLCKKGDDCEFLHEYDMTKMPECYFFSKFGKSHFTVIFVPTPRLNLMLLQSICFMHPSPSIVFQYFHNILQYFFF
jgi:hypothetical protein